jgi:hypothetical protein
MKNSNFFTSGKADIITKSIRHKKRKESLQQYYLSTHCKCKVFGLWRNDKETLNLNAQKAMHKTH